MKMVGHKTEAIYRRYAISDERSMRESASKLDKFHAADQRQTELANNSKVKPIFASDQSFSG